MTGSYLLNIELHYNGLMTDWGLLQHTEFFAHLYESLDAAIKMFASVTSRDLYSDARFALGHYWIVETSHVDAFILQACSVVL